jgi:hypothetical protein
MPDRDECAQGAPPGKRRAHQNQIRMQSDSWLIISAAVITRHGSCSQ